MPRRGALKGGHAAFQCRAAPEAMKGTVWVTSCKSWYLDRNGNPALWPWSFDRFRAEMQAPDLADFDLAA